MEFFKQDLSFLSCPPSSPSLLIPLKDIFKKKKKKAFCFGSLFFVLFWLFVSNSYILVCLLVLLYFFFPFSFRNNCSAAAVGVCMLELKPAPPGLAIQRS